MVGTVDAETKPRLVRVIDALAITDGDAQVGAFLDLGIAGAVVDRSVMRTDLLALAQIYLDRSLGEVSLSSLLGVLLMGIRGPSPASPRRPCPAGEDHRDVRGRGQPSSIRASASPPS